MRIGFKILSNYCHYIFFTLFFVLGICIFKDFGFNIDESFHRRSGFYWLNFLSDFLNLENISNISKEKFLSSNNDFTMPWGPYDKTYGLIFDVPAALIEIILDLDDPLKIYEMRQLLTFLYFFLGVFFFYKMLIDRFENKFIALLGCLLLVATPRLFGDSFQNNKDIIFLCFFIISMYFYFQFTKSETYKSIILFSLFSAIATSTRLLGLIFPISFFLIYVFSLLSNKKEINNLEKILTYFFLYFLFLFLHWPYLWSNPINNFFSIFNNLHSFGPPVVFFNDIYYNTKLVPYSYLTVWILISTPVTNLILTLLGLILILKVYINKLFNLEKSTSKYDFWNDKEEKNDFFVLLTFIIIFFAGTFFVTKHYNSWRIFYFLNFFFIYFATYFVNEIFLNKRYKKYLKFFITLLIVFISFNFYRIYLYHPYQSLYFNSLLTKQFKNKFEVDFTGLSGIKFLRNIAKQDDRENIKIGVNSWYPLWRMKELLSKEDKKRITIVHNNLDEADYIYSNRIYNVNKKISKKFKLDDNFILDKQLIIDGIIVYEVFKK